jgi:hypothetical protein
MRIHVPATLCAAALHPRGCPDSPSVSTSPGVVLTGEIGRHHLPYRGIGVMANPTVTTVIPLSTKAQLNP